MGAHCLTITMQSRRVEFGNAARVLQSLSAVCSLVTFLSRLLACIVDGPCSPENLTNASHVLLDADDTD